MPTKCKINCTGYNAHRLKDPINHREALFAALWKQWNIAPSKTPLLHWLRSSDCCPQNTTDDEERMAATVIQWLGSNVGQDFLLEAGIAGALPTLPRRRRLHDEE